MLVYTASLPPVETADVVTQELTVNVDGVESVETHDRNATVSNEFSAADNASVTLTLVHLDDATPPNRSEPRVFSFTATDTIAPAQPGELGVTLVREE